MHRSRIVQTLNGGPGPPHHSTSRQDLVLLIRGTVAPLRGRLSPSLAAVLMNRLFEQSARRDRSNRCAATARIDFVRGGLGGN